MKNSTLLGSAASVLLVFSVMSYSRTYIQLQEPKPPQQPISAPSAQVSVVSDIGPTNDAAKEAAPNSTLPTNSEKAIASSPSLSAAVTYFATAYSLRGRTASGKQPARGIIAADPRVLPIGTRVRIEAGEFSGEYVVADTGGMVKGRRVDIWTPNAREAMQFGKRAIKLTVLEIGGKKASNNSTKSPAVIQLVPSNSTAAQQPAKPQK